MIIVILFILWVSLPIAVDTPHIYDPGAPEGSIRISSTKVWGVEFDGQLIGIQK